MINKLFAPLLIALILFISCEEDEGICYRYEREGNVCVKCWESTNDYDNWLGQCWVYALLDGPAAIDSICNCE